MGAVPCSDTLFDPEFFLASLTDGWQPRVVAVHARGQLAGIVYAKERFVSGIRLGVTYADLSFGSVPIGDNTQQANSFLIALQALLDSPGTRGIRLRVLRSGAEVAALRKVMESRRLDAHFSRVKDHAVLHLPESYQQFVLSLGSTTRHNFRYYRRRFEAAGHTYLESLSMQELRAAAAYLESRCTKPSRPSSTERILTMVGPAAQPLMVGLRHKNGEWLSVIGGMYRPGAGLLLLQLNNDRNYPQDSLSLVLRAYLIETLIAQGMREFIIWAGTAAPLSRYVTHIPTIGVHLDVPSFTWRLARWLVSTFGAMLPRHVRADARWISPFCL